MVIYDKQVRLSFLHFIIKLGFINTVEKYLNFNSYALF